MVYYHDDTQITSAFSKYGDVINKITKLPLDGSKFIEEFMQIKIDNLALHAESAQDIINSAGEQINLDKHSNRLKKVGILKNIFDSGVVVNDIRKRQMLVYSFLTEETGKKIEALYQAILNAPSDLQDIALRNAIMDVRFDFWDKYNRADDGDWRTFLDEMISFEVATEFGIEMAKIWSTTATTKLFSYWVHGAGLKAYLVLAPIKAGYSLMNARDLLRSSIFATNLHQIIHYSLSNHSLHGADDIETVQLRLFAYRLQALSSYYSYYYIYEYFDRWLVRIGTWLNFGSASSPKDFAQVRAQRSYDIFQNISQPWYLTGPFWGNQKNEFDHSWLSKKIITDDLPQESISKPNPPSIQSWNAIISATGGGGVSNLKRPVEYRFDWGNGVISEWTGSHRNFIYSSAGIYNVRTQARSKNNPQVISEWSESTLHVVYDDSYTAETPPKPEGESVALVGQELTYSIPYADNNTYEYRFSWGDDFVTDWGSSIRSYVYNYSGEYQINVRSRLIGNPYSVSEWSSALYLTIEEMDSQDPYISVNSNTIELASILGEFEIEVLNSGTGTIEWIAEITEGKDWMDIVSGHSGVNSGTVIVSYSANPSDSPRSGNLSINADGVVNSPVGIQITQEAADIDDEISSIEIIKPDGRSDWFIYDTMTIEWKSERVNGDVNIELWDNNNEKYMDIDIINAEDESYEWYLSPDYFPAHVYDIFSIRIVSADDESVYGQSTEFYIIDYFDDYYFDFVDVFVKNENGNGIADVKIELIGDTTYVMYTNQNGFAWVDDPDYGDYLVLPSKDGYRFEPEEYELFYSGFIYEIYFTASEVISDPLVAPVQLLPVDGTGDVDVRPVFEWEAVEGADHYILHSNVINPSTMVIDETVTATSFQPGEELEAGRTFHWRVRAVDGEGQQGQWSDIWEFTTASVLPVPDQIVLLGPTNASTFTGSAVELSWQPDEVAGQYELVVTDQDEDVIVETVLEAAGYELTGLDPGQIYHWRVRGINESGPGPWSELWSFEMEEEVQDPLVAPVQLLPVDGTGDVDVRPVIEWEAVEGADHYILHSNVINPSSMVIDETVTATSFQPGEELEAGRTFHWRVRAVDGEGQQGQWSDIWEFTTASVLPVPDQIVLLGPTDASTFTGSAVELSWQPDEVAGQYELVVTDQDEDVIVETVLEAAGYELTGLDPGQIYHWRVRGINESGPGPWSELWSFETQDHAERKPPVVEIIEGPLNDSTIDYYSPYFSWKGESDEGFVTNYEIELNGPDQQTFTTSDTEHQFIELADGSYEFRVRAIDDENLFSEWATRVFTIEVQLETPQVITLQSPAEGESDVPRETQFQWNVDPNSNEYHLQISTDVHFFDLIKDQVGIIQPSYTISEPLEYATIYYWRVRGINESGYGDWSNQWFFETTEPPVTEGLSLIQSSDTVELVWSLEVDAEIELYRIYRGFTISNLTHYDTVPVGTNRFTLPAIPDGSSFYTVTAVTADGHESEYSNIVSYYKTTATVSDHWSLLSIPVESSSVELSQSQIYGFNRVYQRESSLSAGNGYWVRSSSVESIPLEDSGLESISIELNKGWNLIGGLVDAIPVSSIQDDAGILTSTPVYEYQGGESAGIYVETSHINPTSGHWIYAIDSGSIYMSIRASQSGRNDLMMSVESTRNNQVDDPPHKINFSKGDIKQVLWSTESIVDDDEKYRFLLPPLAPDPLLDVRFSDGLSIMDQTSDYIELTSRNYPIGVLFESSSGGDEMYRLIGYDESGNRDYINLLPGQQQLISREYESLQLERIRKEDAILETRIKPSFPNPFNPTTNIRYELAQSTEVLMDVYDVVGRRVARLVNHQQHPGQYTVQFDGSNLASGVYFLRLQAGSFVDIQKLTLIK
jgi:hypothetical protein